MALVFAKLPRPGVTKTRLARVYGPDRAAQLAAAYLRDTLARLAAHPAVDVVLVGDAPDRQAFGDYLAPVDLGYVWQGEGDLGERQLRGAAQAFERGWEGAILLGADTPHFRASDIDVACSGISRGTVVVGPAVDGGYFLLGWPRSADLGPILRAGVAWGTPTVLETLRARLREPGHGRAWIELQPLEDFDEAPAFERWWRAARATGAAAELEWTRAAASQWLEG